MAVDLRQSGVGWNSISYMSGDPGDIRVEVWNDGTSSTSETFLTAVYLSADGVLDDTDYLVASALTDGLVSGEQLEVISIGDGQISPHIPSGEYWWIVSVDDTNSVVEEDEQNNVWSSFGDFFSPITIQQTVQTPTFAIEALDAEKFEGHGGVENPTEFTFLLTRTGDLSEAATVTLSAQDTSSPSASFNDFTQQISPDTSVYYSEQTLIPNLKGVVENSFGEFTFAPGESELVVTIEVVGDSFYEGIDLSGSGRYELFTVAISDVPEGALIDPFKSSATGQIFDDDTLETSELSDGFRDPVGYANTIGHATSDYWNADYSWNDSQNPFGNKVGGGYHIGVDWNISTGGDNDEEFAVYATSNGTVVDVGQGSGLGNYVVLGHSVWDGSAIETYYSLYAHLEYSSNTAGTHINPFVGEGDLVQKGEVIGQIGSSGLKGDPAHLHFEIFSVERGDFSDYFDFGIQQINKKGAYVGSGKYSYTKDKSIIGADEYTYIGQDRDGDGTPDYEITWHDPSKFIDDHRYEDFTGAQLDLALESSELTADVFDFF